MPTLSEILNRQLDVRKNSSGINRSTGPGSPAPKSTSIRNLSRDMGLGAIPSSPLEALSLGASPQSANMVGSAAQTQAAIANPLPQQPGTTDLNTFNRRAAPSPTPTQSQGNYLSKLKGMDQLGDIPTRVNQFVEAQKAKLLATQTQAQVVSQDDFQQNPLTVGKAVDYAKAKGLLDTLKSNPQDSAALATLSNMFGRVLTGDDLKSLYVDSVEAIASGAAGSLDKDLTLSDLAGLPEFGMSLEETAQLLGLSLQDTGKLSISQLVDKVKQIEEDQSNSAQVKATSPLTGRAEAAGFQELGRELAATGVETAEVQLEKLTKSIQDSETVQFAGQPISIEKLLGDEGITQTIRDYLSSLPDSDIRKKLDDSEPGLSKFIRDNEEALTALNVKLGATSTSLEATQKANADLSRVGSTILSDTVMKSLLPAWGTIQAGVISRDSLPLFKTLDSLSDLDRQSVAGNLNAIATSNPNLLKDLASITDPTELVKLANPDLLKKFSTNQTISKTLNSLDPTNRPEDVIKTYLGDPNLSVSDLQLLLDEDRYRASLGLSRTNIAKLLDANSDGKVDSAEELLTRMKSSNGDITSLTQLLSGDIRTFNPPTLETLQEVAPGSVEGILSTTLLPALLDDGQITESDLSKIESGILESVSRGTSLTDTVSAIVPKIMSLPEEVRVGIIPRLANMQAEDVKNSSLDLLRKSGGFFSGFKFGDGTNGTVKYDTETLGHVDYGSEKGKPIVAPTEAYINTLNSWATSIDFNIAGLKALMYSSNLKDDPTLNVRLSALDEERSRIRGMVVEASKVRSSVVNFLRNRPAYTPGQGETVSSSIRNPLEPLGEILKDYVHNPTQPLIGLPS